MINGENKTTRPGKPPDAPVNPKINPKKDAEKTRGLPVFTPCEIEYLIFGCNIDQISLIH